MRNEAASVVGIQLVPMDPLREDLKQLKKILDMILKTVSREAEEKKRYWMTKKEACAYAKMSPADFDLKRDRDDFPFEVHKHSEKVIRYKAKEGF